MVSLEHSPVTYCIAKTAPVQWGTWKFQISASLCFIKALPFQSPFSCLISDSGIWAVHCQSKRPDPWFQLCIFLEKEAKEKASQDCQPHKAVIFICLRLLPEPREQVRCCHRGQMSTLLRRQVHLHVQHSVRSMCRKCSPCLHSDPHRSPAPASAAEGLGESGSSASCRPRRSHTCFPHRKSWPEDVTIVTLSNGLGCSRKDVYFPWSLLVCSFIYLFTKKWSWTSESRWLW